MNVPSEGNKNRIVTKSHPGLIIQAQRLRKGMMKILSKDRRVSTVLTGRREEALNELQVGKSDDVFLSSDLSAASDRMSHEVSLALWFGLVRVLDEIDLETLSYCLGPQILIYPEGTGITTRLSTNGILMGLPLTWVTLNLLHLFWIEESALMSNLMVSRTLLNTRICGDDLVAHWPAKQVENYETLVIQSNGAFSEGKHFKS